MSAHLTSPKSTTANTVCHIKPISFNKRSITAALRIRPRQSPDVRNGRLPYTRYHLAQFMSITRTKSQQKMKISNKSGRTRPDIPYVWTFQIFILAFWRLCITFYIFISIRTGSPFISMTVCLYDCLRLFELKCWLFRALRVFVAGIKDFDKLFVQNCFPYLEFRSCFFFVPIGMWVLYYSQFEIFIDIFVHITF